MNSSPNLTPAKNLRGRIARERNTLAAMIGLYCRDHHHGQSLCEACRRLEAYALTRLDRCPFGEAKTTCVNCPVHCYQPELRERIREVMRHAGPRMLWRHPWLALGHLMDGLRDRIRGKHRQVCDPGGGDGSDPKPL